MRDDKVIPRVGHGMPGLWRDRLFSAVQEPTAPGIPVWDPWDCLGIALGLALYEIGELRDRLHHVEENLPASVEKDAVKGQEEPAAKTMAPVNRK